MLITTLTSLITIVMVPFGWMVWTHKCWDIAGEYNHESKIVYLCEWVPWDINFTKYHEFAHFYYFNILGSIQKEQYHKEYLKAYSQWSWSFFREYGYRDEKEDFADNFALMIQKKRQPYKIQKRINLIKKYYDLTPDTLQK